jgi:hypothetical protein
LVLELATDRWAAMQQRTHAPVVSFVIRLWAERRDVAAAPEWRFRVQHVQSGEGVYVRTLADLLTFVERQSGLAGPSLPHDPSDAELRET